MNTRANSLRQRAAAIDLEHLDDDSAAPAGSPDERDAHEADRPRTGVGAISASLALGREIEEKNRALQARVTYYEDKEFIEYLNPEEVGPSRFANRHELSFDTAEYQALRKEIESAGHNVVPIKVRRAPPGAQFRYEIVYGHRRHHCCLELKLPVRAFVVDKMGDAELVVEMERENRTRADLSAWEQGKFYATILDQKLFPSIRRLGEHLGVDFTVVSRAVQLVSLPDYVVEAFPSPLELQYRWAAPLQEAANTREEAVRAAAEQIRSMSPRPAAKAVFDALTSAGRAGDRDNGMTWQLQSKGKAAGSFVRDGRGAIVLKIKPGVLGDKALHEIEALLKKHFDPQG